MTGWMELYRRKQLSGMRSGIGDTTIVPLVDVSFGIGAGSFSGEKKEKGMGGIGGKITPSAVLVIKDSIYPPCEHPESGYDDKDPRHGAGTFGSVFTTKKKISYLKKMLWIF